MGNLMLTFLDFDRMRVTKKAQNTLSADAKFNLVK